MLTLTSRSTVSVVHAAGLGQPGGAGHLAGLAGDGHVIAALGGRRPGLLLHDVDLVADELLRERRDALGRLDLVDGDLHALVVGVDLHGRRGARAGPRRPARGTPGRPASRRRRPSRRRTSGRGAARLTSSAVSLQPRLADLVLDVHAPGATRSSAISPSSLPPISGTLTLTSSSTTSVVPAARPAPARWSRRCCSACPARRSRQAAARRRRPLLSGWRGSSRRRTSSRTTAGLGALHLVDGHQEPLLGRSTARCRRTPRPWPRRPSPGTSDRPASRRPRLGWRRTRARVRSVMCPSWWRSRGRPRRVQTLVLCGSQHAS